jgi:hypothetical protein
MAWRNTGEDGETPDFSLVLSATGFEGGVLWSLLHKTELVEPCTIPIFSGIPRAAPLWC